MPTLHSHGKLLILQIIFAFIVIEKTNQELPDKLSVKLRGMTQGSSSSMLINHIYDIPFCKPSKVIRTRDSIGDYLTGSYRTSSSFEIGRMEKFQNRIFCTITLDDQSRRKWKRLISNHAKVEIYIDGRRISYRFGVHNSKKNRFYYRRHIRFHFGYNLEGYLTRIKIVPSKGDFSLIRKRNKYYDIYYSSVIEKSYIQLTSKFESQSWSMHIFPL